MQVNAKSKKIMTICFSDSEGGLELASVKFAKKFLDEGNDSIVVCHDHSKILDAAKKAGLKTFPIASNFLLSRFVLLLGIIREQRPDVVVTHRSIGLKMSVLTKLFFPKLFLINFLHTLVVKAKKDFFHRYFYSRLDELVVFTEVQRANVLKYLPINSAILRVVPHFVNTQVFKPKIAEEFVESQLKANGKFRIGCVGRFDLKKGQLELIEAARLLKDKNYEFEILFVGRNTKDEIDVRGMCEQKVKDYGLEKYVLFFDFQNSISNFYQSFDLFVMPSHAETFGMVLIEAMACGCLCMATSAGGPIEILDNGSAGLLVSPQSFREMAQGIEKVIQNPKAYSHLKVKAVERALKIFSEDEVHVSQKLLA